MSIQTELTCPLGHTCEKVEDGKIKRCAWLVTLKGSNPQTGEDMDETGCAMGWLPVLLVENARTNRGTTAAVESLRNVVNGGQAKVDYLSAAMAMEALENK